MRWTFCLFLLFLSIVTQSIALGQKENRLSLKGVGPIQVIMDVDPILVKYGIGKKELTEVIELLLRQSEISVTSQLPKPPSQLYLNMNCIETEKTGVLTICFYISYLQMVFVPKKEGALGLLGETWATPVTLCNVGYKNVRQIIELIKSQVGEFVAAYLSANLKK